MLSVSSLKNLTENNPNWALAVLRISIGIMFAVAAIGKVSAGTQWPQRMVGFLNFHAEKSYDFYRTFLEAVVLPNKEVFGYLVAYGEVFVALSLILGLFTRLGAAIGLFMVVNFLLAKGSPFWIPSANDPVYILALFTLLCSRGSIAFGLDRLFGLNSFFGLNRLFRSNKIFGLNSELESKEQ